jgi:5'-nucleotidase
MGRTWSALVALALLLAAATGVAADETARPCHVLVANDDGVDAPGLAALAAVLAADPAYRVTVVAPTEVQSGMGHAVVIEGLIRAALHEPVAGSAAWSVDGTPATTVRVALSGILAADPPDLVLSGINRGENVGRIAWYSGTVAAAREAVLAGVPAVAFSLQLDWSDPRPDFAAAARWAKPVVDAVRRQGLPAGVLLNVNIPRATAATRGYRLARMGLAPDQVNRYDLDREEGGQRWYRSRWAPPQERAPGSDTRELDQGWVTVVPLGLDQTELSALPGLLELELSAPPPATVAPVP